MIHPPNVVLNASELQEAHVEKVQRVSGNPLIHNNSLIQMNMSY